MRTMWTISDNLGLFCNIFKPFAAIFVEFSTVFIIIEPKQCKLLISVVISKLFVVQVLSLSIFSPDKIDVPGNNLTSTT